MPFTALLLLASLAIEPAAVSLAPHGEAFLTPGEVQAVRARVADGAPWADVAAKVIAEADALAAKGLDIPHEGGQWTHWYTCPEDGGRLRAASPTEHVCPVCGAVYSGWPYDAVYITLRHSHWLRGIETLGWAYTLDPKPVYAERVRDILREYARFYRDLPLHDKRRGDAKHGARLYAQTLDESVTLCHMMMGYDRVYNAGCFTAEDHAAIAEGLVYPMVETIKRNRAGKSNWQTWHNAGIACAGFVLRDKELVHEATNGQHGLLYQLTQGSVLDSGMWYEGAPSYHWYALTAIVYQLEASARAGMDLYGLPIVKKLFDGPMRLLFPDLTFPALNDSDRSSIQSARRFYEIAWKHYNDPKYTVFLEPRDATWALFWGGQPIPDDAPDTLTLETSNDESDGIAILRSDDGETALFFEYGPAMSGHVHPAKLGIILYAHGDERFVDPGRLAYGNPLHGGWYTQTIAHNTVVVNGQNQARCTGTLVQFEDTEAYSLVRARTSKAYEGVTLDRTLILCGDLIFDVVYGTAEETKVFDLPLHIRGTIAADGGNPVEKTLGDNHGYQYVRDLHTVEDDLVARTGGDTEIGLHFLAPTGRFLATGYGSTPRELLPCIIQRQQTREACFAQAYDLEPDTGPAFTWADADDGVRISIAGGPAFSVPRAGHVRVE